MANIHAQMTALIREHGLHEVAKAIGGCIDDAASVLERFELLDEFNVHDESLDVLRGDVIPQLIEHTKPVR